MDTSLKAQFLEITSRDYAGQARFFLNGFWKLHEKDAEDIWGYVHLCISIDHRKGKAGNELDELEAHRFLEQLGETLTVADMRNKLREIDIDFNKRMALIEYLIFRYKKEVKAVITAPQGGVKNREKLAAAEKLVDAANAALDEVNSRLEAEKQALAYQKIAEQDAKRAEQQAKDREDEAIAAENEQKAALAELTAQEMSLANKKAELKAKSENEAAGQVSRNKAKNELEQLKTTDPLPLQRAKLNQGATVRKSERAREEAEKSRKAAEAARIKAEESSALAHKSVEDTKAAVDDANKKLAEAVAALEEIKRQPDQSFGDIWWLEREMIEKKKYLPRSKQ